jgi:DNA processing protein
MTSNQFSKQDLQIAVLSKSLALNSSNLDLILKKYSSIELAIVDKLSEFYVLKPKWKDRIAKIDFDQETQKLSDILIGEGISLINILDPKYPKSLTILDNAPITLFYQGNLDELITKPCVTVVGSRQVDIYGEYLCNSVLGSCCSVGVGVVSGLALGIDSLSHQIALKNNAYTIGVLGSGLTRDVFYPSGNWNLRNQIIESGGCVMTEFYPDSKANIYTFPQRNRILAALTEITWVVQASVKSGSLITALKARDIGKILATSPADIRNKFFSGNIKLIKEGCEIITESEDVFGLLGLKSHGDVQVKSQIDFDSAEEERIYKFLSIAPINIEKIITELNIDYGNASVSLSLLELKELVRCVGSNDWVRL